MTILQPLVQSITVLSEYLFYPWFELTPTTWTRKSFYGSKTATRRSLQTSGAPPSPLLVSVACCFCLLKPGRSFSCKP